MLGSAAMATSRAAPTTSSVAANFFSGGAVEIVEGSSGSAGATGAVCGSRGWGVAVGSS